MMPRISAAAAAVSMLALAAAGAFAAGGAGWSEKIAVLRPAEKAIEHWPSRARSAARVTLERYGRPAEVGDEALVWHGNGPWRRTTVHRRAGSRHPFRLDGDFLENTIRYDVPERFVADLARFDRKLTVDPARGELSSRADSEASNFLALNLADEIVTGVRGVDEARAIRERVLRYSASGKESPYLRGLRFAQSSQSRSLSFLGR